MATIRKIQRQSGIVFKAIVKDRLGALNKSKVFKRKTDVKAWVRILLSKFVALLLLMTAKRRKLILVELVDKYMFQRYGKDVEHLLMQSLLWVKQFNEYCWMKSTLIKSTPGLVR